MTNNLTAEKWRISSIDILRGLVMIIMALDHVRDFFHIAAMVEDPTNLNSTTPALFFTRWITHYCAPIFVFLSGTSAFLSGQKKTKKELSSFLLKRGLFLMVLEIVVVNFLIVFDPLYRFIGLQVIWVIGLSMVLLSFLIYLPLRVLFIIGIVMVVGHNMLDGFNYNNMNEIPFWHAFFHQQLFTSYADGRFFAILYPLIPWPGVMLLGYCMGAWYVKEFDAAKRKRLLLGWGLTAIAAFFILRWINVYGDLVPWSTQKDNVMTILSFFNVTKYPPSLLYLCMTLGPALLLLIWLEKVKGSWTNIVSVYGRVPMFYYLLHFFTIHVLCIVLFFATGRPVSDIAAGNFAFRPNDFGFSLPIVYLIWIAVVAGLYPLCKRYDTYKMNNRQKWWTGYL
ncbi:DUF1624 domain-containing protein [Sediminibacterium goheungense]|uniref:Putative membrane protein n=1 Tax=Sediminibacterium goheungense TaxID=1086393 RepID=A0A4R6IZR5_9BACT|nr:heparan-alpha-glucosaminide N-acetyltransferase domain-containing protein [Sediminibacterium goheungense]TDO28414.1 putative membrane protein [Sediminibacterium goheungense]